MKFLTRRKYHSRKKKIQILIGIIVLLILIRALMPVAIRLGLNNYLKDFSPSLTAHVDDVDLAILKGSYSIKGINAEIKGTDKEFLEIGLVTARLAWKDLFQGNIIVAILIDRADLNYTESLIPALKKHVLSMKEKDDGKPPGFKISRLDLKHSSLKIDLFPSSTILSNIEARAKNLIPTKQAPLTPFSMQGTLLGSGLFKSEGEANLENKVAQWSVDSEVLDFDLTTLNKFLKRKVPLTFTSGRLDLYAEAITTGGTIKGYVKPFIKGLDVIKNNERFIGPKHWFVEVITALGNLIMKKDQTVAMKIPFTYDKKFKLDRGEGIANAFEHRFLQKLDRGIENSLQLDKETRQAQEEK